MDMTPQVKYNKRKITAADVAHAKIYFHYAKHKAWLTEDQLIKNAKRLKNIPGVILHGRYDMVCPIEQAYTLHKVLPNAELHIVRDAGHSAFEAGTTDNLIRATDDFARSRA